MLNIKSEINEIKTDSNGDQGGAEQNDGKLNGQEDPPEAEEQRSSSFQSNAIYDDEIVRERREHSRYLSRLKPEVLDQLLEAKKRNYGFLKKLAVERLDEKIQMKMNMMYGLNECEEQEPDAELAHNVFSWSVEDFLKRSRLTDYVWLDVMQRMSGKCLEVYKFRQDVEQMKGYLRRIFDGIYAGMGHKKVNIERHVARPIREASDFLYIINNVENELNENTEKFSQLAQKDTFIANLKRESADKMMKVYMETKLMNCHIWNPIELRYQVNWHNSKVSQMKYFIESTIEARHQEIANFQKQLEREVRSNANCLDYYYANIGSLKSQLKILQNKLNNDVEAINNRIFEKKQKIEKLKDEWNFHKEEIERFHEETKILQMKLDKDKKEREERQKLQEEAWLKRSKSKLKVVKPRRSTIVKVGLGAEMAKKDAKGKETPKKAAAGTPKAKPEAKGKNKK